jgi:DNA polymerase alpha subunit B
MGLIPSRLEGLVPNTPRPSALTGVNGSTVKRKADFRTPASKANKAHEMSSPGAVSTPKIETAGGAYVDISLGIQAHN